MQCDKCRDEAIFYQSYSGRHLCKRHIVQDIESRAKRSIRSHRWMRSGDHIAVAVSGNRTSAALLCFLKKLTANRRDIRLSAVPSGDSDTLTDGQLAAVKIADSLRIPCIKTLLPGGTWTAADGAVTKIAIAISLDDVARGVLGEFLFGNLENLVLPHAPGRNRIQEICPFITIPSDELALYWEIEGTGIELPPGLPDHDMVQQEAGALFEDYSRRHPATKYALLHLAEQLSNGNAAAIVFRDSSDRKDKRDTSLQK